MMCLKLIAVISTVRSVIFGRVGLRAYFRIDRYINFDCPFNRDWASILVPLTVFELSEQSIEFESSRWIRATDVLWRNFSLDSKSSIKLVILHIMRLDLHLDFEPAWFQRFPLTRASTVRTSAVRKSSL